MRTWFLKGAGVATLAVALSLSTTAVSQTRNTDGHEPPAGSRPTARSPLTSTGPLAVTPGIRILIAPSQVDNAGYRAAVAAITGGPVDYLDARANTPSLATLTASYDCVFTWADNAYQDRVTFG